MSAQVDEDGPETGFDEQRPPATGGVLVGADAVQNEDGGASDLGRQDFQGEDGVGRAHRDANLAVDRRAWRGSTAIRSVHDGGCSQRLAREREAREESASEHARSNAEPRCGCNESGERRPLHPSAVSEERSQAVSGGVARAQDGDAHARAHPGFEGVA